jgi:hypothetical protein
MALTEAARAVAGCTANDPQEFAPTGKRRGSFATTFSQESQALARITARAENHLSEVEWRISRLGQFVASGQVDRSLVTERLGVAIELARLEGASFEPKVELQNCSSMSEAEAPGSTEEEIERAAAVHQGEPQPIKSRHQIYYAKNREKVREAQRLHYNANRQARRERARKYYLENSERERERLQRFTSPIASTYLKRSARHIRRELRRPRRSAADEPAISPER